MTLTSRARQRLEALRAADLHRRPPVVSRRRGVEYHLDGRPVIGFCSNDYLGLADDPRVQGDSLAASGATASRLICGHTPQHGDVESQLAAIAGTEDAVLFPSGFQANVGALPCLLEPSDVVSSDRLNHASLIDGLRLARARVQVVPHATRPKLQTGGEGLHVWVTESIFSMDGDRASPLAVAAHRRAGGVVYVDEAHAFGLFHGGGGLFQGAPPDVALATLSKAYGAAGAVVAASRPVCELLRNRARSFVFSTGTSPALLTRIAQAAALVSSEAGDALREQLWQRASSLQRALVDDESSPPSPIFPLLVGDNTTALDVAADLMRRGFHVQAIRPPTVPPGTARLRLTVTASHTEEQIQEVADAVRGALARRGLSPDLRRGVVPPHASTATQESDPSHARLPRGH